MLLVCFMLLIEPLFQSEESLKKMVDGLMAKMNKLGGLKKDLMDHYDPTAIARPGIRFWRLSYP